MKNICLIIFLLTAITAFSQNKIVIPGSVVNYRVKPLSLYLNEQPKGFFHNNESALHGLSIPFNRVSYNSVNVKSRYNTASYDVLNPLGGQDPLANFFGGSLNYFLDKVIYHK